MLYDTVNEGNVAKMVREFYATLVEDDLVGPYFVRALGTDLKNEKWYEHYQILNKFWLMLMNGEPGYFGDPFGPHAFLGELKPETFERWLELFKKLTSKYYTPEIADKFYRKSEILAKQFIERLEITGEEDE